MNPYDQFQRKTTSVPASVFFPPFSKGGQGGFLRPQPLQSPSNPPHSPFSKGGRKVISHERA